MEESPKTGVNRRTALQTGLASAAVVATSGPASILGGALKAIPVAADGPATAAIAAYTANIGTNLDALGLVEGTQFNALRAIGAAKSTGTMTSGAGVAAVNQRIGAVIKATEQAVDPLLGAAHLETGILSPHSLQQVFGERAGAGLLPEVALPDGRVLQLIESAQGENMILVFDPKLKQYVADIRPGRALERVRDSIGDLLNNPTGRQTLNSLAERMPDGELKKGVVDLLRMENNQPATQAAKELLGRQDFNGTIGELRQDAMKKASNATREYRRLMKDHGINPDDRERHTPLMEEKKATERWKEVSGLEWLPELKDEQVMGYVAMMPLKHKESGWKKIPVPSEIKPYVVKASVDQLAVEEGHAFEMRAKMTEEISPSDKVATLTIRIPQQLFLDEAYVTRTAENLRNKAFLDSVKEETYWNSVVRETDGMIASEENLREKAYLGRTRDLQAKRVSALQASREKSGVPGNERG